MYSTLVVAVEFGIKAISARISRGDDGEVVAADLPDEMIRSEFNREAHIDIALSLLNKVVAEYGFELVSHSETIYPENFFQKGEHRHTFFLKGGH